MESPSRTGVVSVTVPPRAEFVHVLRAVTASVAARIAMSYDAIEDLRLAVDEASAWLLGLRARATVLTLRLAPDEDGLEATVTIDAVTEDWPPARIEDTFSWRVLSALVDSVALDADRGGPSIRMSKHTLEPSATA